MWPLSLTCINYTVPQELAPFKETIVATGGGIVQRGINWGHMQVSSTEGGRLVLG